MLTSLSPELLFLASCALVVIFAAFVHGSVGLGFPMIATPLLASLSDLPTAIMLTLLPTTAVNLMSIASEGRILAALRRYWLLALMSLVGSAIGTQILIASQSDIFKLLLAVSILSYLALDRFKLSMPWIAKHPGPARILCGLLAGLLGGLTNVMAPVLIVYALESKLEKREFIQASNLCFLGGKLIQLCLFSLHGRYTGEVLGQSALLVVFVLIALNVGIRLRRRLSSEHYRPMLKGLLLVLAGVLFYQYFS
ncbi:sulfite exporter TauE/SafE family protein [Aliagarivorans marinus]|uniref:sulfite exporter TauE/SafE family protein n=1 Tax=Aliagarivorans marinus TaxID=561965 RepID=UPI000420F132|nr:sulfite exporter TauE/SafE family protein [Aliagarivorans marinus]